MLPIFSPVQKMKCQRGILMWPVFLHMLRGWKTKQNSRKYFQRSIVCKYTYHSRISTNKPLDEYIRAAWLNEKSPALFHFREPLIITCFKPMSQLQGFCFRKYSLDLRFSFYAKSFEHFEAWSIGSSLAKLTCSWKLYEVTTCAMVNSFTPVEMLVQTISLSLILM